MKFTRLATMTVVICATWALEGAEGFALHRRSRGAAYAERYRDVTGLIFELKANPRYSSTYTVEEWFEGPAAWFAKMYPEYAKKAIEKFSGKQITFTGKTWEDGGGNQYIRHYAGEEGVSGESRPLDGMTVQLSPSGNICIGHFVFSKIVGYGHCYYPDGRKYLGDFRDGMFHGHGHMTDPDGTKYIVTSLKG